MEAKVDNNKVNVVIAGEIITLKSLEQPEYLQRLARYVDQKIEDILSKSFSAAIDERVRTLLVAFNIADDYHKSLDNYQRLDAVHKRFITEMGRMQDQNAALQDKIEAMEMEMLMLKAEIEEHEDNPREDDMDNDNVLTMPLQSRKGRRNNAHLG